MKRDERIQEVLISEKQIADRVAELGKEIDCDYNGKNLILVGVLKGSVPFLADLTRAISIPHKFDMVGASSYLGGTSSSGSVVITKDIHVNLKDKDVLLIEDIYDTGQTMRVIVDLLKVHQPASLKICSLLYKDKEHEEELEVKYVGFNIPDKFVIGYGLDYEEYFRNLPFVGVFKP